MKRGGWIVINFVVLCAAALLAWRYYRIQPLPLAHQSGKPVFEAHNLRCPDPTDLDRTPVILTPPDDAADQDSMVKLRWERLPFQDLQKRIPEIFATRADRTVYVVYPGAIPKAQQSKLIQLLIRHDFIDRVCLIDPKNPPQWYPIRILMYPTASHF
jgi:hypothetical protein